MTTKKQLEIATKELLDNRNKMIVLAGMSKTTRELVLDGVFKGKLHKVQSNGEWELSSSSFAYLCSTYCLPLSH